MLGTTSALDSPPVKPCRRSARLARRVGKYGVLAGDAAFFMLFFVVVRAPFLAAPVVSYQQAADGQIMASPLAIDWFLVPCGIFVAYSFVSGQYSRRRPFWEDTGRALRSLSFIALIDITVLEAAQVPSALWIVVGQWGLIFAGIPAVRVLVKRLLAALGLWQIPSIIIGTNEAALQTYLMLKEEPLLGYSVICFINISDSSSCTVKEAVPDIPLLNKSPADLPNFLSSLGQPQVIGVIDDGDNRLADTIDILASRGQIVDVIPDLGGLPLLGLEVSHMFGREAVMLHTRNNLSRPVERAIKRLFDIVGTILGLIVLAPLMGIVAYLIKRTDGGPAFYRQTRVGADGKNFTCLKFRSMHINAEETLMRWKCDNALEWQAYTAHNNKLPDDPRITPVGRFIRRTSIDELPQLFNVLRGEMSLVGPRPLMTREVAAYGTASRHYIRVRPGITGLWQVSGRSSVPLAERAAYDSWYIKNWSLWYDIIIILRTIRVVLRGDGAY